MMRLCGLISPCPSRRYLPVLRGFPAKYIYDPWNAPDSVQTAAKCIIGVHYPKPMVNHAEASRLNIERMKQIYQQLSRYRGLGKILVVGVSNLYSMTDEAFCKKLRMSNKIKCRFFCIVQFVNIFSVMQANYSVNH